MNVRWLSGEAWLDADGYHVWLRHRCVDAAGNDQVVETMLPHPIWRVENGHVVPSVMCDACGLHALLEVAS